MSKRKKKSIPESLTPEQIIRLRLHRISGKEEIWSFIFKLIMMIILMVIMFGYIFGIASVRNNDMFPKLSSGDLLFYYRLDTPLIANDVVVFEKDDVQYVGRIVAQGGDSVVITDEARLQVNGSTIVETDIFYQTPRYVNEIEYPLELEEDQYFILCDNRDGAIDSRYFGAVNKSEIKGKVIAVIRRSSL